MTDTGRLRDALISGYLRSGRQQGPALIEIDSRPLPDSWINPANVERLARWLAPNMTSLLSGEERPPLPNLPETPGKVPSTGDPRYPEALAEAAMIGSSFVPVPIGGAARVGSLVERGAAAASKRFASRSPFMYNPPKRASRPFEADYPQGARADASGLLTHDIEGRPLTAPHIAGRKALGGVDEAIGTMAELDSLATQGTGQKAAYRPAREMGGDFGHTLLDKYSGRPTAIELRNDMRPDKVPMVYAHEIGHVIDQIAGHIPTKGLATELRGVYNTLNNPNRTRGGFEAAPWGKPMMPQAHGYRGTDIPREYMAEATRAYLADPNYIKTVAPETAKRIRSHVNSHPTLSKIIQFNAIGGLGLFGPLRFPLARTEQRSEPPTQ